MFLLSYMFIAVVVIYIVLAIFFYKFTKKRFSDKKYISKLAIAFFILLPTYDIIITNILGGYYCLTTSSTYINKKVEYPESIYWEDNVYPGFNAEDRKLMVMNYLDGVHLKTMALNGDDGKIYIYETNASVWEKLKPLEKERGQPYYDMVNAIAQHIMETSEEVYTKETMPKTNYTVTFDEIKLNPLSRMFLYSDEMNIVDNNTKKVVAKNQRVMKLLYNITPRLRQIYYNPEPMCGENKSIDNWFFGYLTYDKNDGKVIQTDKVLYSTKLMIGTNHYLYNKHIKGEK